MRDLSYLKPTVKENITTKTNALGSSKIKNITTRDSRAIEINVTFLETGPPLFARILINISQIFKLFSFYPNKYLK